MDRLCRPRPGCEDGSVRRHVAALLGAALLLGACTTPAPAPRLSSAAQEAARKAEFQIVPLADRQAFPAWRTIDLDGYDWSSANLTRRFAVVNFWASWCQPCVDEWPDLQAAAANHPSVQFIGIATMDERPAARRFLQDYKSEYRHLLDPEAFVLKRLTSIPNSTLPTTIILDGEHRVAAWKVGPVLKGQLRRALAALLQASSS